MAGQTGDRIVGPFTPWRSIVTLWRFAARSRYTSRRLCAQREVKVAVGFEFVGAVVGREVGGPLIGGGEMNQLLWQKCSSYEGHLRQGGQLRTVGDGDSVGVARDRVCIGKRHQFGRSTGGDHRSFAPFDRVPLMRGVILAL
jgi:hypothetical protein